MAEFTMPALGADMESGTLLEWKVAPGDEVKRGDIVAVVDTDKAEIEVEVFEDGVIDLLLVEEGTRVPVGTPLATLTGRGGEAAPAPKQAAPASKAPSPPSAPPPASAPPQRPSPPSPGHRPRVSPLARRIAAALGVDLAGLTGTGAGGAITQADVERAAGAEPREAAPPAPADRHEAMRHAIGQLMARSKREIPHYYLQSEIDMSSALSWMEEQNLHRGVAERLLPSALLISATAKAVAETQELNGFWVDDRFLPGGGVHLGIAISLRGGGLIAPAIHDAERLSLNELMATLRDLVARGRAGRLRSSEMSDPTITVTNLGETGADLVHGVIYPPQVALVGFGAIRIRPWASEDMIGPRPVVCASLAADHRASDGHVGSRLLALLDRQLQKPEGL